MLPEYAELMVLDFLRFFRNILYSAGRVQVFGLYIDFLLHLAIAFVLAFLLRRWLNPRKTSLLIILLIAVKELVDIFAKSRIEYIRPPGLDLILDVIAGLAGICLGLALAVRLSYKWPTKSV